MSNLLIDDYPILVLPNLATEIGLNEAIVLQQMHYWLKKSNHNYDGRRWIYNSYKEWEQHFPFWSNATIRRTISSLEKQELLFVGNYNKAGFDNTKWYSIDYFKLEGVSKRLAQNEQTTCSKRADGVAQNEQTNTRDYTEITTETTNNNILSPSSTAYPYKDVINYLNQQTGKHYKSTTKKNQTVIRARTDEGFTLDDFKQVINKKVDEWKGTDMEKYLRPETLFGTKFEGYLNQETQPSGMDQLNRMKYDESYWD
ncbi:conserved phage C-terminal domain-containing protein [Staphylococcus haemolyticus]|uniref:conserved phage C-terminal domain-containing protein n=1 Tax=Staphylococcus haemolyticus TaxID=1283 RepID=UPI00265C05ED|nr:conserved phage C-terminal domain-containing protein [Staphylococcus haemolyticus]MDO0970908.1 conserved phage C-terminal domain-containing protein [Staphylococcus haemolyticus]